MMSICQALRIITLWSIHRTTDPALLFFLAETGVEQLMKRTLTNFFHGRSLGHDRMTAVRYGIEYGRRHGCTFSWLCVTKVGVYRANIAALCLLGIEVENPTYLYGDPKVKAGRINASAGVVLRFIRNLVKTRGCCKRGYRGRRRQPIISKRPSNTI